MIKFQAHDQCHVTGNCNVNLAIVGSKLNFLYYYKGTRASHVVLRHKVSRLSGHNS